MDHRPLGITENGRDAAKGTVKRGPPECEGANKYEDISVGRLEGSCLMVR